MSGRAATRPFVDRPATDTATAAGAARSALAEWGVVAEPILVRKGMNVLFAAADMVIRVGSATAPAATSHQLVRTVRARHIPTVRPIDGRALDVDGFAVTAWEWIDEVASPIDWERIGAAVRSVHDLPIAEVPPDYPVPSPAAFPWWDFDAMLADTDGDLDDRAAAGLRRVVERYRGWEVDVGTDVVLCHGDVHPGNVMATAGGSLLIDWDLLCRANPAWDHVMLLTFASRWGGDQAVYAAFASGYGRSFADDELARSLGELRNVAATLMKVRATRHTPAAVAEAERRLRYWRGDPDAPSWVTQ